MSKQKTKIFIDFDATLFDTGKLKKELFSVLRKAGFSDEEILLTYKAECKDYLYSPKGQVERLKKVRNFDFESVISQIEKLYEKVSSWLYNDTIGFLKNINREKFEVNLLTLGDISFQKKKVESAGIKKLFDNIYYCAEQKWDFLKGLVDRNEKFFVIDDRGDALEKINHCFPDAFCIEINRLQDPLDMMEAASNHKGATVQALAQAEKYLATE